VNFIKGPQLTKEEGVSKDKMRELVRDEVSAVVRDE